MGAPTAGLDRWGQAGGSGRPHAPAYIACPSHTALRARRERRARTAARGAEERGRGGMWTVPCYMPLGGIADKRAGGRRERYLCEFSGRTGRALAGLSSSGSLARSRGALAAASQALWLSPHPHPSTNLHCQHSLPLLTTTPFSARPPAAPRLGSALPCAGCAPVSRCATTAADWPAPP
jgi:hypothetical protein